MIYVDASVAIAELLVEDRKPPPSLWEQALCSSRLLEYEIWTRVNARGLAQDLGEEVQQLLSFISMVELTPLVLSRALDPFPVPVRALDALHLASASFMHGQGRDVAVATYDQRMARAARAMGFALEQV